MHRGRGAEREAHTSRWDRACSAGAGVAEGLGEHGRDGEQSPAEAHGCGARGSEVQICDPGG